MIGTVLGNRYEILSEIGSGGMAKVYRAKDRYLQRIVAIKLLKEEFREDSEFLKRFDTEAQAAASLTHPNIVQIYDIGVDNNRYYIVMEFVDGITLKEYIARKGALDWKEAVNISLQVCSALAKAHSRNIIHRDIKPTNIIMTSEGIPKVADFGIARSLVSETDTVRIDTIGSVHYSSPEQARGGYTDEQSDIYSMGVTMFEMVTGTLPFEGETPVSVALKHIQEVPPVPSSIKPDIPQALDEIILTAMAKSRQDRYATVSELINDLKKLQSKPGSTVDILLPEIKKHGRPETRNIQEPLEEEFVMASNYKKPSSTGKRSKSNGNSNKFVMPVIYILLIATILGSIGYFVKMIINEIVGETTNTQEVVLGNYVNRNIDEVLLELESQNIRPVEVVYEPSDTIPENIVISQFPTADSTMKLGGYTTLRLVVSSGAETVEIPNVEWQDHSVVKLKLEDEYKLKVVEVAEFNDEVPAGLSIRTDPPAKTQVKKGTEVTLYWSKGPEKKMVIVPDLIGDTYEQALKKLMDARLKLGETFPKGSEGHRGKIVDQAPKAGETVVEDTPVVLYFEEKVEEPGGNMPIPGGHSRTITIGLPQEYNDSETVRLRVILTNVRTGDQTLYKDLASVPVTDFPYSLIVPVFPGSETNVRAYIDDILVYDKTY
ncbi:MAG: Stk1 family PASTA domain-containing Ser/Thr kinase [Clostridiaceae bacterium]|nr:Stk1 family PASTA domain-containing Ser/Thr kinase [Clostridiaceae bacterium]